MLPVGVFRTSPNVTVRRGAEKLASCSLSCCLNTRGPCAKGTVHVDRITSNDEQAAAHGVKLDQKAAVATPDELANSDAIIFGTPTRFGNMAGQMRTFLDQTGGLWVKGALVGKIGSVFASTGTQHGGQETTITSFHSTLLHQGMVIVGVPYSCAGLTNMSAISGGSPYGASTMAGTDGSRQPSQNELDIARFQGKHVAEIALKIAG